MVGTWPQSQRSVLTGDLRAYETREVTIPPRCVALRVVRPRVNEENRTPCEVGHDHLPLHPAPSTRRAVCAPCPREVPTLRLPRCELGALPLSYGCVECAGGLRDLCGNTIARSARLVSNEAFRCIRAASSPADSGPSVIWWTQGVSEARPPACRAGALPLSYVSVVVMGGFDPPPRAFQARALPTELHDHGAGPGTRTRISWITKPVPNLSGPAGIV